MGDIGERTAVDKRGRAFQRLDEIWLERVLQKRSHGADSFEVAGSHRLIVECVTDDDARQALFQVSNRAGEAEDRHDLAGHGDIEAVLTRNTVESAAETVDQEA